MAEPEDTRETLDQNRWGILTRDAGGFAIWRRSGAGEPLASFPSTDDGSDDAWEAFRALARRGRRDLLLPRLLLVAIISAILWVVATTVVTVTYSTLYWRSIDTTSWNWLMWVQAASTVAYSVFVASVGTYVVLWLDRRSRRDGG